MTENVVTPGEAGRRLLRQAQDLVVEFGPDGEDDEFGGMIASDEDVTRLVAELVSLTPDEAVLSGEELEAAWAAVPEAIRARGRQLLIAGQVCCEDGLNSFLDRLGLEEIECTCSSCIEEASAV